MQIKKVLGRIRQILGAAGRWLAHALRFRRGNLLDRLLRTVVILVLLTLAGGWLITNCAAVLTSLGGTDSGEAYRRRIGWRRRLNGSCSF